MINKIIRFSINNKLVVGLFTFLWIGVGIYSLRQLPIDAVPDITNNQVQVVTISPSLAPQEVEKFITYPIEISMANVPGVIEIRSISRFGLSVVTIVFKDNIPVLEARQLVGENLNIAKGEIPENLGSPELMPITTGLGEIFQYTVDIKPGYESKYNATDLRTIQDWIVKRQLSGTAGIVEISSFGGYLKQYQVSIDPIKIRSYDVTINEIQEALSLNNENTGGSYIQTGPYAFYIRAEGLLKSIRDIENVVVKQLEGLPLLIKDIAQVEIGHSPRFGAMTKDGKGEVVGGITLMLKGENASEAIQNVKERIAQITKSLPEGIELNPYLDRAELVSKVIKTVQKNLIEGGLIVIFILVLLLGSFRGGLIVASVIPLSMLFAFSLMNIFGVSANLMSLGAIDFGIIVDGAVIVVESIIHHLHLNFKNKSVSQKDLDNTVYLSASNIMRSAVFGMLIILIVFFPIMSLVGIEGKTFRPMAFTVSFALIGALILCLTYVPMMASVFMEKEISKKITLADKINNFIHRLYKPFIRNALAYKKTVLLTAMLLLAISLFVFTRLGAVFIPTLEEGDLAMQMNIPPGSSLNESIKISTKAEQVLLANFPEVKNVVSKIGTAEVPTDPMAIESADIMIILKDKDNWTSAATTEELAGQMKEKLEVITGGSFEFTQPIQLRFNELMTGVKSDIALKIYGEDIDLLFQYGNKVKDLIQNIPGAADVKVEQIEGLPQIFIDYRRDKMARYGLNIKDLNETINAAMAGGKAGIIYEGERKFDLVVRLNENYRNDSRIYEKLFIRTASGMQVPLMEVANIRREEGPMQISRDNTQRQISIGINVRGRDIQSLVEEIKLKLDGNLNLPPGYFITYGGQFENLKTAIERLEIAVPVALGLIFILLYFTFNSLSQALIIFSAIPFSAIGGIIALWLRNMPFSISAGIGFVALFGVAVLDGLVLISCFNQLKKEGVFDLKERILKGTALRIRPVVMTSLVASLGFLPMALSTSVGGEVQRPLATVVIGGLVSATILTLLVLPVIYSFVESGSFSKFLKKSSVKTAVILLILTGGFIAYSPAKAQELKTISLQEAIGMAVVNNPKMKDAELKIKGTSYYRKSALNFGDTELEYTKGQINDAIIDYQFFIKQNFGMPLEHSAKVKFNKQEVRVYEVERENIRRDLVKNITLTYYEWVGLLNKKGIINQYLQYFDEMVEVADLRYETGDSNLLSKIVAETWREETKVKLNTINADIEVQEGKFQQLIFTEGNFIPDTSNTTKASMLPLQNFQDSLEASSPLVKLMEEKYILAQKELSIEKSRITPKLSLGYFNQSLLGVNNYDGWQVKLAFPLWFVPQKGNIQAKKIEIDRAANLYVYSQFQLNKELEIRLQEYRKYSNKLDYFENTALKQAEIITGKSGELYQLGEIGYYEHIQNLSKAVEIRLDYWDTLKEYNKTIIQVNYLIE
ncbi:CusA/CzcA family heavy metal efflux RND transporter [Flexithrix dorotheae]|uniref:CusA/CzcA family heavy metal efflux RND transporter n=1 Tax=Flexithrix dorotheae TaxID=70993 RepID=UPI000377773D|nr:CusA/CzcA family heavy metal efflux RND transporter [Flexithrix dorotheae]